MSRPAPRQVGASTKSATPRQVATSTAGPAPRQVATSTANTTSRKAVASTAKTTPRKIAAPIASAPPRQAGASNASATPQQVAASTTSGTPQPSIDIDGALVNSLHQLFLKERVSPSSASIQILLADKHQIPQWIASSWTWTKKKKEKFEQKELAPFRHWALRIQWKDGNDWVWQLDRGENGMIRISQRRYSEVQNYFMSNRVFNIGYTNKNPNEVHNIAIQIYPNVRYDLITANCQTFVMELIRRIKAGPVWNIQLKSVAVDKQPYTLQQFLKNVAVTLFPSLNGLYLLWRHDFDIPIQEIFVYAVVEEAIENSGWQRQGPAPRGIEGGSGNRVTEAESSEEDDDDEDEDASEEEDDSDAGKEEDDDDE